MRDDSTEHAPAIQESCADRNRLGLRGIRRMLDSIQGEPPGVSTASLFVGKQPGSAKQGKGEALEVKRANRTEVNAQWI